ncbi:MAG: hypothetical protein HPY54_00055 [Chthonomonadetes bacterium]|nr:hypothetical protein [Chthonomonadetes bacterium]
MGSDVCSSCLWEDEENAWLCKECARKHDCGEEYFLPVVNSPRVGQCGYTGGERVDIDSETELW